MPIEIRELVIRATTLADSEPADELEEAPQSEEDRKEIVADCVKQVLEILERKRQR